MVFPDVKTSCERVGHADTELDGSRVSEVTRYVACSFHPACGVHCILAGGIVAPSIIAVALAAGFKTHSWIAPNLDAVEMFGRAVLVGVILVSGPACSCGTLECEFKHQVDV